MSELSKAYGITPDMYQQSVPAPKNWVSSDQIAKQLDIPAIQLQNNLSLQYKDAFGKTNLTDQEKLKQQPKLTVGQDFVLTNGGYYVNPTAVAKLKKTQQR